ncbi:MAG TPA: type IV pilus modification protein PilV [Lysobacter sp.]
MHIHSGIAAGVARRQSGVGLIEVLIAVLVLAIGVLGIAALQAKSLRNSQSALERSQAVVQTYSILEAMRANAVEARAGGYTMAMACKAPPPRRASSNAARLAGNDQAFWIGGLQAALGEEACGTITCAPVAGGGTTDCTVTVRWDDSRGSGGSEGQEVTTVVRI